MQIHALLATLATALLDLCTLCAQTATAAWATADTFRTTAGPVIRSLPVGTPLRDGDALVSSWNGTGYTFASASATCAVSNEGLVTSFRMTHSINAQSSGTSAAGGSISTSTTLTLHSPLPTQCFIRLDYTFPILVRNEGGGASIDIGDDGSIDWVFTYPEFPAWSVARSTTISFTGTLRIRIHMNTSAGATQSSANTTRSLQLSFDPSLPTLGAGSPNSLGVPSLCATGGAPVVGNPLFGIQVSGQTTPGLSGLVFNFGPLLGEPGLQIPGAPVGCRLYIPIQSHRFVSALVDGNGNSAFPLPIPPDPLLVGATIGAQSLSLDPTLSSPLPLASSPALLFRIGSL